MENERQKQKNDKPCWYVHKQTFFILILLFFQKLMLKDKCFSNCVCQLVLQYNVHCVQPTEMYNHVYNHRLKVHKNENFIGFDFEFCTISLLVMSNIKILQKKLFDWASIGGGTIFPRSPRTMRNEKNF
jgi:hypothetical protein